MALWLVLEYICVLLAWQAKPIEKQLQNSVLEVITEVIVKTAVQALLAKWFLCAKS